MVVIFRLQLMSTMLFLAPDSMTAAVKDYCKKTGQIEPATTGELLYCVYHSLANCYAKTVAEIEQLTNKKYDTIHVVGGGCQDRFLNALLASQTGKKVFAGPIEATALGNIMAQALHAKVFTDLPSARKCVAESFSVNLVNDDLLVAVNG